jgi:hypothetical protein
MGEALAGLLIWGLPTLVAVAYLLQVVATSRSSRESVLIAILVLAVAPAWAWDGIKALRAYLAGTRRRQPASGTDTAARTERRLAPGRPACDS